MGRRSWVKLWCLPWIEGHVAENDPDFKIRGLLASIIALAGDCDGDDGLVTWTKEIGLTAEQIATRLRSTPKIILAGLAELQNRGYLTVGPQGQIAITDWRHFQSEYQRQKPYRQSVTKSYKGVNGGPVTKSTSGEGRREKGEVEEDKSKGSIQDSIEKARKSRNPVKTLVSNLAKDKSIG
jgi:hypothetical protein